jgi:hypothetical protein
LSLSDYLKKNFELRNIHRGERCFIIGNGPSLNQLDLTHLYNEIKICVNSFHYHPDIKKLSPDYWVLADPNFWKHKEKNLLPILNSIESNQIHTKLFLPIQGKFSCNNTYFLNLHYYKYNYNSNHDLSKIDFCKEIPPFGENVLVVSLMLALYLGCNPIYFIGADHSWWGLKKEENTSINVPHFYDSRSTSNSNQYSVEHYQTTIFAQKYQYLRLKQYAQKNGFTIFNATEGGKLELFDRVKFEELFQTNGCAPTISGILETLPNATQSISRAALELIQRNDFIPALALLDEAMRQNINRKTKIQGLHYLRSLCLAALGHVPPAITEARLDIRCNPSNRENTEELLQALNDA